MGCKILFFLWSCTYTKAKVGISSYDFILMIRNYHRLLSRLHIAPPATVDAINCFHFRKCLRLLLAVQNHSISIFSCYYLKAWSVKKTFNNTYFHLLSFFPLIWAFKIRALELGFYHWQSVMLPTWPGQTWAYRLIGDY